MHKLALSFLVLFVLSVAATTTFAQVKGESGAATDTAAVASQVWYNSWTEAATAASASKRQVLLVVQTEWCRWCRAMNDTTWVDPNILRFAKTIVFTRIDGDLDTAIVSKYHIHRFPTTILVSEQGVEVDRFVGYFNPDDLEAELTRALEGAGTMWDLERKQTELRGDPSITLAIGREHLERGEPERAQEFFVRALAADQNGARGIADDALFAQAQIKRNEENWYKAIELLKKLIKDYPDSEWREDAELYVPWLYAQAGDKKEAIKRYNEFLEKYGSSSETQWVKRQLAGLKSPTEVPDETPATQPEGQ